ncbi:MAG TPA: transcriptional regulator, partial [Acidobacteriota bacterium]|nr:transcriptional regulator [Acidobacteriota bacterium]
DLSETGRVKVRIIGKVLDERYTRMLMLRSELNLLDVIALDKVQKRKSLTEDEFKFLKTKHLIEGRRPNLFISASVAAVIDTKDDYIKKRAFDKDHYKKMIVGYLEKFGEASRSELNKLLLNKLSDALNEEQKIQFVTNLLQDMRREGSVQSVGITRWAKWSLNKLSQKDKN